MGPIKHQTPIQRPLKASKRSRTCAGSIVGWLALALAPLSLAGAPAPPAGTRAPVQPAPQAQANCEVKLTKGLATLGESIAIRVVVEVPGGRRMVDVKFEDMAPIEGLSFERAVRGAFNQSMVFDARGRAVSKASVTYQIPILVQATGDYSIPPINFTVDGKRITLPVAPMSLRVVEDLAASDLLNFERGEVPERVFEGEPFEIELTWGWDAGVQAESVRLRIPWYENQDGVVELDSPASGSTVPFPVNRSLQIPVTRLGRLKRRGIEFESFRMLKRFVATRPGTLEFSRSIFELRALGARRGRIGRSRDRTYYGPLDPFSIEVVPVPEAGRPIDWTGAVGKITVSRQALQRDVDAGAPIDFELTYTGEGNLEFFPAPDLSRLAAFDDFRVLGIDDEKGAYERVITYDLVPLKSSLTEVPPVPLVVFDTGAEAYKTLETEPLSIRVRKVESADGLDPFGGLEEDDEPPAIVLRDIAARPTSSGGLLQSGPGAGTCFLTLLLGLVSWRSLRRSVRRRGDPASQGARQRRGALKELERSVRGASGAPGYAAALERFLAARTGTEPGAWIGASDLIHEHTVAGDAAVSPELREMYRALRRDLDAEVFGGDQTRTFGDPSRITQFARRAVKEGL